MLSALRDVGLSLNRGVDVWVELALGARHHHLLLAIASHRRGSTKHSSQCLWATRAMRCYVGQRICAVCDESARPWTRTLRSASLFPFLGCNRKALKFGVMPDM